jgi:metallo-beta-lactamase family protein
MVEGGEIPKVPVFLDSPLAEKVTSIYKKFKHQFKDSVLREIDKGDDIFDFPSLNIVHGKFESNAIEKVAGPKIIIAGSGMSEGGRVVSHEAASLDDPKSTIILAGYQSVGTLGRLLKDGAKFVTINDKKIKVRAKIVSINGYSSHKDSNNLIDFVEKTNSLSKNGLKRVFVIMGEAHSSLFLCQRIADYVDVKAIYPEENKIYNLE